jgi:hypothetical protein
MSDTIALSYPGTTLSKTKLAQARVAAHRVYDRWLADGATPSPGEPRWKEWIDDVVMDVAKLYFPPEYFDATAVLASRRRFALWVTWLETVTAWVTEGATKYTNIQREAAEYFDNLVSFRPDQRQTLIDTMKFNIGIYTNSIRRLLEQHPLANMTDEEHHRIDGYIQERERWADILETLTKGAPGA